MEKVIIMCGGRGNRLRPMTENVPKPLVPLNGEPILKHIIQFYMGRGFEEFILCVGYKGEMIRQFVDEMRFDAQVEISDSGENAGILKRIYAVRERMGERAIVTYGDTFINIDIDAMRREHESNASLATITIAEIRSPFGLVNRNAQNWVASFDEKPLQPYYIGHMLLQRAALDAADASLVAQPDGAGLIGLFQTLIARQKLLAYLHNGLQITFNTMQEYHQAETAFMNFYTQQEDG